MTDLITRLSALTGPDREVDAEIAILIGDWQWSEERVRGFTRIGKLQQHDYRPGASSLSEAVRIVARCPDLPRYTGSLDVALTLESEKRHWRLLLALAMNRTAQREGPLEKWMLAVDCCIVAIEAHHD